MTLLDSLAAAEAELVAVSSQLRSEQQTEHAQAAIALIDQARTHVRRLSGNLTVASPVPPPRWTFSDGKRIRPQVDRDPAKLLPPFADKVELLFQRLRAQGFDPLCWETYRSPERAAELTARGTGRPLSMHCYGVAVDIVGSDGSPWREPDDFWQAIGETAEELGLVWGGRWTNRDLPHVQAVKVKDQERFRRMSEQERIAYLSGGAVLPPSTSSTG